MTNLSMRKATTQDLKTIIALLLEDELGETREVLDETIDQRYIQAFKVIDNDPNQYLMVVEKDGSVVGTCHLTIMPSLTFIGSTRMQIEAVRVSSNYRGRKIGEYMIDKALEYTKTRDVKIIQLTTNKKRQRAENFYEKLGFEATHEGMKLFLESK